MATISRGDNACAQRQRQRCATPPNARCCVAQRGARSARVRGSRQRAVCQYVYARTKARRRVRQPFLFSFLSFLLPSFFLPSSFPVDKSVADEIYTQPCCAQNA